MKMNGIEKNILKYDRDIIYSEVSGTIEDGPDILLYDELERVFKQFGFKVHTQGSRPKEDFKNEWH